MKDGKSKDGGLRAARKWVTVRVTGEEKMRLTQQAETAGLSLSEYMRRRFFGGRPLVAHVDIAVIAELRKLGGLLKHNFEALRQANAPESLFQRQEEALRNLVWIIQKIGLKFNDRQKNQEH